MTSNKVTTFFKIPFKTIADIAKDKDYNDVALRAVYLNNTGDSDAFKNKMILGEELVSLESKNNEKLYDFLGKHSELFGFFALFDGQIKSLDGDSYDPNSYVIAVIEYFDDNNEESVDFYVPYIDYFNDEFGCRCVCPATEKELEEFFYENICNTPR